MYGLKTACYNTRCLEESLTIRQEINYRRGIAESLNNLGRVALAKDKPEEARPIAPDVLAAAQSRGQMLNLKSTAAEVLARLSKQVGPLAAGSDMV